MCEQKKADMKFPENNLKKLWDSEAEEEVFQYLQQFVNTESFYICPHMPVSEVFKDLRKYDIFKETYIKFCELLKVPDQGDRHFELSHFDFTVYRKSDYFPVLIIEVDGAQHKTNPEIIFFDKFKNWIAEQKEVPLIRLALYEANMDIRSELEESLKNKKLNNPYNYPVYCRRCGQKFLYRSQSENGSFYYCRSCNREGTDKSLTITNSTQNCPPLFVWDIK